MGEDRKGSLCVLGPVELGGAGPIRSARVRRLLAALAVRAGSVVSADHLAEAVWGADQPADPGGALHTLVSRLRAALDAVGGPELRTRPPGYLLEVDRERFDAAAFEDLVTTARAALPATPSRAAGLLDQALGLWRGPAYAEFADQELARAEAARLEELRLAAVEDRAEAELALGRPEAAVARLEQLAADHPLRERPVALRMLAMHRAGRSADALAEFRAYRELLDGELGLEPSAELRALETDILRQHPGLGAPAAAVTAGNLPVPVTGLVGREAELAAVGAAIDRARVVTLTGPGGVGKTLLAVHAARARLDAHPDGVWLVELAAVADPDEVASVVATTLGVEQRSDAGPLERLVEYLRAREPLLVIDNCEHVLDEAARLVETVVRGCPAVRVLATSREPLAVEGEQVWPVPPLAMPAAVRLFGERAAAASPGFAVDDANEAAVAEICRRLDGLPLALELAATRVRSLAPAELAGRLTGRFRLLRTGRRVAEARHQTLVGVVDWSYGLLGAAEQHLFDRLSVFAGSFGLDAAERVCAGDGVDEAEVADLIASLVDKSMVAAVVGEGATRYVLLETLREFGRERLAARGEAASIGRAHAAHQVAFAERAATGLTGPDEGEWLQRLGRELHELRAAAAWAAGADGSPGDLDLAMRLSAALLWYGESAIVSEVFGWAERAARLPGAAGHPLYPVVLSSAAAGARFRGDLDRAGALAREALAATDGPGDPRRAFPLNMLGEVALFAGRLEESAARIEESARLLVAAGTPAAAANGLANQALALAYGGDVEAALTVAARARELALEGGSPTVIGWATYAAGEARLETDPAAAAGPLDEAIVLARSTGNRYLLGAALVSAASLRGRRGDPAAALPLFGEAVEQWHRSGNWVQQWTTLRNVIEVLIRLGADHDAAVLLGAMDASATAPEPFGPDAGRLAAARATLGARLGPDGLAAALAEGAARGDAGAVAFALERLGRQPR